MNLRNLPVFVVVPVLLQAPAPALDEFVKRPTTLKSGIGEAHDPVGTASKQAQALYDQGLAYLHNYVWLEAARSFNQALGSDPKLAVAYCGLAVAYTELNASSTARNAMARAQALAPVATDHDRRHIEARALQLSHDVAGYRKALDAALAAYPDDEEFLLARGQAESNDPDERGQGSVAGSVAFYEKARALAPSHVGPHHYLTHAYENTGRLKEALEQGEAYARLAPAIPHARHMYGHDLRRGGRIFEAIAEFRAADAAHREYFKAEGVPPSFDWHFQHNLDLLATSYQYVGQMSEAEPLLKESFAIPSTLVQQEFNKREWPVFLLARGRTDEALAAANTLAAHASPVVSAIGHVQAGHVRLAQKQYEAATAEANAALRLIRGAEGGGMVAAPLQALQGEFFLRTGQPERGRAMLQDVVKKARLAPGPDAWTQALFTIDAIARAAREVGDWELARWAARQMLEHDPYYAGSHYAAALAARHDGDEKTARAELALAAQYWAKADPGLPELRIIRSEAR